MKTPAMTVVDKRLLASDLQIANNVTPIAREKSM